VSSGKISAAENQYFLGILGINQECPTCGPNSIQNLKIFKDFWPLSQFLTKMAQKDRTVDQRQSWVGCPWKKL
jgi:hypothetical protein